MGSNYQKPHAVCVPYPAQGHVTPMLKVAKILHSKGFHITFVNTEFNHQRLLKSRGPNALDGLPSFRYETIPDGLPPSDDCNATQNIQQLCSSTEETCGEPFKDLILRLNQSDDGPPVTCIVSDSLMFFTLDAAEEFGILEVLFWTASACGLSGYAQYQKLVESGVTPFKDPNFMTNGDVDQNLNWETGMKDIRLRDIPSFVRTTDPDDFFIHYVQRMIHHQKRASAIIINTYEAIEHDVLQYLSTNFPPIYTFGPSQLILEPIEAEGKETKPLSSNLWKEDPACLSWLDKHAPGSVVYVNYGSITVMTHDQLIEFAWGLANTKLPFLWITRPDLVRGETVLPPEFLEETRDRSFIASWCNQEQVLAHPAIGGFLTHSGWNSTLETICNGVPIICWPFFAEQQTNCWFSRTKWGFGMEIDTNVKRDDVEKQVKELLEGEKGKEMKRKILEWKVLAQEATAPNGSSYVNLDKLINTVLTQSKG